MPVTVRPQPEKVGVNSDQVVRSSANLLERASQAWTVDKSEAEYWGDDLQTNKKIGAEDRRVLHSSFNNIDTEETSSGYGLVPYGNGFVDGILRAFEQDLHLVLRPDDVWLAILVQFSFYVNGHSEDLRQIFVQHEGKKTITINMTPLSLEELEVNRICEEIIKVMKGLVVDEELTEWLLPQFSTTTVDDQTVAALTLMATMKSYFEYRATIGCGFPSVTLRGEKEDWENLAKRVEKFAAYGEEPAEWSTYLTKVLEQMTLSFDKPEEEDTKDFWMRSCHAAGYEGSGNVETLSGWITAFCFWDDNGQKVRTFDDNFLKSPPWHDPPLDRKRLVLDGLPFPVIARATIPKAVSDVPVLLDDIGAGVTHYTTLVSGIIGMEGSVSDETPGPGINQFQPKSGWWMLLDKTNPMISGVATDPSAISGNPSLGSGF